MKFIKSLLYIIIAVIVLLGLYFAYIKYTQISKQPKDALYIIPNNAALIFGAADYSKLRPELNAAYRIWDIIEVDNNVSLLFATMDSVWNTTKIISKNNLSKPKVYYSLHYVGNTKFNSLLSISFDKIIPNENINKLLNTIGKYSISEYEDNDIYKFQYINTEDNYYIANIIGNICISKNESLIKKVIGEQKIESENKAKSIKQIIKIAGKNASANIYINHNYFYKIISSLSENKYSNTIKQLKQFTQYSVLDIKTNSDNINLNGYSYSADSIPSRLKTYSQYEAPTINIFENIPSNTSFIYYQGANEFNKFIKQQSKTDFNVENVAAIKKYKADLMTDISKYFYPWIKNELALCYLNKANNDGSPQSIVLMNSYDLKETGKSLHELNSIICNNKDITIETDTYRTFVIQQIHIPYLLPKLFGSAFSSLNETYYITTNSYVVFANSKASIKNYINSILVKKTLAKRKGFDEFREALNNESHIMLYANAHFISNLTTPYWNKTTISYLDKSNFDPNKFGDVCIQFIVNTNGAFTSINISTNDIKEKVNSSSWQLALDYNIKAGPFIIKDHNTNENNILVFDEKNTMYRINSIGEIKWAIPVPELPIGTPKIVDYYKNGKYQFLFNSKSSMYMYDLNGNSVENFPVKLESEATAPLSLIDYDNKRNYRILIPLNDGAIHNYQIDGSITNGWLLPTLPSHITTTIQHFSINNKDFILLCDTSGNVVFSNRKGVARIETKLAFTNNIRTKFYKYNNQLITTDIAGRVISIGKDGSIKKVLYRDFSPKHRFYLFDINGDKKKEFVFYDKNIVYAYNDKQQLLWSKKFDFDFSIKPQSIGNILKDSSSIIVFNNNKNVFEFGNESGVFTKHEEFLGSQYFLIYKATKSGDTHLISVKDRIVSNYLLN